MDYRIALFIHVFTIATWFGAITLMAMYLRDATRSTQLENMAYAIQKSQRWNLTMMIPTSVLAFLSGLYMLLQSHSANNPTWLIVKERFGTFVILAFILIITFYGRKLVKSLQNKDVNIEEAQKSLKRYIMVLNLTVLCMVILMAFVTLKLDF